MQLYKILQTFSQHFAQLEESTSDFQHFEENDERCSVCIFAVTHFERHRYAYV